MKEGLFDYWNSLINDIPHELYMLSWAILIVLSVLFVVYKGIKNGLRHSIGVLLAEYVILIYCSTVIFRPTGKVSTFDITPLWSYRAYWEGREPNVLVENFANVLVFVPVGILLGGAFRSMTWWKALLVGVGISVSIEVMQLMLKRGFCEVDDVMHNSLGCLIGYGIYKLVRYGYKRLGKRSMAVL